jgi:hypothetical protein
MYLHNVLQYINELFYCMYLVSLGTFCVILESVIETFIICYVHLATDTFLRNVWWLVTYTNKISFQSYLSCSTVCTCKIGDLFRCVFSVFLIQVNWIRIQTQIFCWPPSFCWIWIHSGSGFKPSLLWQTIMIKKQYISCWAHKKHVQASREAPSPTEISSNVKFFHFFPFLGQFWPACIWIQNQKSKEIRSLYNYKVPNQRKKGSTGGCPMF